VVPGVTLLSTKQTTEKARTSLTYLPGLDGLRALAVAGVLLYHADLTWFRGGYLGVDVFFVLSGFLISSLLLAEWGQRGKIDLKAFWLRRARRLLPALFLMLVASLAFAVVFLPEEVASLRNDAIAAATYVTNWYLVVTQRSYFETVGRPSLFQHLWSLAVEEQFYLLWPLIFIFIVKFVRRWALPLVMSGVAASATFMWIAYDPDADPSRLYYGTDSRAAALLIGVGLAFWLERGKNARTGKPRQNWRLDLTGLGALTLVVWCFVTLDETQSLVYQGGMLALELATALVIVSLVRARARIMSWLLSGRVMQWIGQRSYGIYLWHWPVFMVTRPQLDVPLEGGTLVVLRFAATVALAELSYRFVETPIRGGALARAWNELRSKPPKGNSSRKLRWAGLATAGLGFAILIGVPVVEARPPVLPDYLATQEINTLSSSSTTSISSISQESGPPNPTVPPGDQTETPDLEATTPSELMVSRGDTDDKPGPRPAAPELSVQSPGEGAKAPVQSVSSGPPDAPSTMPTTTPAPTNVAPAANQTLSLPTRPAATQTAQAKNIASLGRITAIGDSVMIGAARNLRQLGDVYIDAQVGRQVSTAIKLLRSYHDSGRLGPVVVLHIGNNGTFTAKHFDDIMKVLSDEKYVVFLNLKVPRSWEWPNNKVIMDGVSRYPNAIMVDWRAASADKPQLFWKDGIHLRPEGAKLYASLIGDALSALASR
jgi:peptidoglycan/LPS O-acetylase OafA/YrhL